MKILSFAKILFVLVIIAAGAALAGYLWVDKYYTTGLEYDAPKTVIIKKGSGVGQIANILAEHGIINHPKAFSLIARFTKQTSPKFGEYQFKSGTSPKQILTMLQAGETVIRKITIAEGKTVHDVLEILANTEGLEGYIPNNIEEGSLMPTTYYYQWGDSYESVINKMKEEMTRNVNELWLTRRADLPVMTSRDAVILASIVEKETGVGEERGLVASVFVNRLNRGMKLESDPTAVYGITKGAPLGRVPLRKDIEDENPYNTYKIPALPPGPICNPGLDSIKAVLNPAETNYIFFVATGNGGHNFAATLDEHNRNVATFRKIINSK
jgi:UPF0755 protein